MHTSGAPPLCPRNKILSISGFWELSSHWEQLHGLCWISAAKALKRNSSKYKKTKQQKKIKIISNKQEVPDEY